MGIIEIPSFYDNKDIEPISIPLFYKNSTNPLNTSRQSEAISIPDFYEKGSIAVMSSCGTSLCGTNQACAACMFSCQPGCQWNCEHRCEDNCEWACQSGCQDSCEVGCEDGCEDACQDYCENWCMCVRQSNQGCLDECENHCMNCEGACMDACLSTCEGCLACETVCEHGCENTCLKSCQDYCENICEDACEKSCQCSSQGCQGGCQSSCESEQAPTAKIKADAKGYHDIIQVDLYELQWPAKNYLEFRVTMYQGGSYKKQLSWTSSSSSHETSNVFEGLLASTTYTFYGYATPSNGTEYPITGSATATTGAAPLPKPPMPSNFRVTSTTTSSLGVAWNASAGADFYQVYIDNSPTGAYGKTVTGTTWSVSGLEPNTSYDFQVTAYNDSGASPTARTSGTTSSVQRPANWAWDTTTTSAGNTLYVMPASRWNAFTARINEFRQYKGKPNYNFTSVGHNTKLTSAIYHEAVDAINPMVTASNRLPSLPHKIKIPEDLVALRRALNTIE